jgi:tetratricopeptide (TPR) repeat protein
MTAELERVLASREFSGSERRSRLLRYLVAKAIEGEAVKEYTIGVDVFEKAPDYDPRIDPSVRVEMGRLRTRLAGYYAGEGSANPGRLEFPKRTYLPSFRAADPAEVAATAAGDEIPAAGAPSRRGRFATVTIVGAVVVCLVAALTLRFYSHRTHKPAENPQARELTVKARFFWNKRTPESLRTSLGLYQDAIRRWPEYAPAYAGVALCYAVMATDSQLPADQASSQAVDAADASISLDPGLAEAHAALGLVAFGIRSDWPTAEAELRRAIALDPNFATAHQWLALSLLYVGKTRESQAEIGKALRLDTVSMPLLVADGMITYYSRHYDETIEKAHRMLEMEPAFREAHLMLGIALEAKQDWAGAEQEFRTVVLASNGDSEGSSRLARVYALSGRRHRAEQALQEMLAPPPDRYVDPYQVAFVFTALGQKEKALQWLEKAVRQHTATIMKVDPYLDSLRGEARFERLLEEAHLN